MGWLGSAVLSLFSSVVNRNEWGITSSRHEGTIGTKKKGVKFFFKFFFRGVWALGCACLGVGAWVWVLGCGCVGVGRRDRDGAGWMEEG